MSDAADDRERLWRVVRGDFPMLDFQNWLYEDPGAETFLGSGLYVAAISTNFTVEDEVWTLREAFAAFLRSAAEYSCLCIRLRDLDVVDIGSFDAPRPAFEGDRDWSHEDVFRHLDEVARAGDRRWWLSAVQCRECGQAWMVGTDSRHNDVFCLRRIDASTAVGIRTDATWPPEFDTFESLLEIGKRAGKTVRYVDPAASLELAASIRDLALERPGIPVSEIAVLLNLEIDLAESLAKSVVARNGVQIGLMSDRE